MHVADLAEQKPEDFVIATGEQHSVREFCQLAFHNVGIELEFVDEGMNEKGIDKATGKVVIEVSPDFYRPTDVVNLWGDPSKAKRELGWNPTKTTFAELVKIMVDTIGRRSPSSAPRNISRPIWLNTLKKVSSNKYNYYYHYPIHSIHPIHYIRCLSPPNE